MKSKKPQLTLLGAGPGDPELFTLKGVRILKDADAVLFDSLANKTLLSHCQTDIPLLYVGKQKGTTCNFTQEEINALIVEYAHRYGHVVRLKGGDPFVFGRAQEEIEYAYRHGIRTQVIPGISSAYAVPEVAGFPLTSRGLSESIWITTGMTRHNEISDDIYMAARSRATVVLLMAMGNLARIMEIFIEEGKSNIPVAVIQHGTLPKQKKVIGTVCTIVALCATHQVSNPAIVVIGEVVHLASLLQPMLTPLNMEANA